VSLKEYIHTSTTTFLHEQLTIELTDNVASRCETPFIASIAVTGMENALITIAIEPSLIDAFAVIMLGEEANSDDERQDLCAEFVNIVVGQAKVIALNSGIEFKIDTPKKVDATALEGDIIATESGNICLKIV